MRHMLLAACLALSGASAVLPSPALADDAAPKEAQSAVEAARGAFAEYKSVQDASNKARNEALKAYRDAKDDAAKEEALARYGQVVEAENAKVKAATDRFVEAMLKAGVDSFDAEKDAALLEIGLLSWAGQLGEDDPKKTVEIYELFLKKLPKANAAPFIRTSYLPNALMSVGDFDAAAKRIAELVKESDEKYAPTLNVMLGDIKAVLGDLEGAQKIYAEVLKSIPEKLERGDPRGNVKRYLEPKIELVGKAAPEIDSKTWLGAEARPLSKLKGTVVLVDVWATW